MKYKKSKILILATTICLMMLVGCGKKSPEEVLYSRLNDFYENVDAITTTINSIDPNAANAKADMLQNIDAMNNEFSSLQDLEIPSKYSEAAPQIAAAIVNMNESNHLYHQAFESEEIDQQTLANAGVYYANALQSIRNVGQLLMNHPIVTEEEE